MSLDTTTNTSLVQKSAAVDEAAYLELEAEFGPALAQITKDALQREQERILPFEQIRLLNSLRFGALHVPLEHGGRGVGHEHLFRLLVRLAEADSNVAHIYRGHLSFVEGLAKMGPEWQQRWYPRVLAGEIFGNASTEASGNMIGSTATKLRREGDHWRVSGKKFYSTGSIFADWITVTTTIEGEAGRQFAIVHRNDPGVEIIDDWSGFGQPLTGTGTAILTEAFVDGNDVLQRVDGPSDGSAYVQLVLLAVLAGIGRAALAEVRSLVARRTRVFNTGSGVLFKNDPQILQLVGEISSKVHTAETLVRAAAREFDIADGLTKFTGNEDGYLRRELSVERAHVVVPELVLSATQSLFDSLGASATTTEKALDRYWRNARTIASHNPRVFKAKIVGDYEVNGTLPVGLWGIGELDDARSSQQS